MLQQKQILINWRTKMKAYVYITPSVRRSTTAALSDSIINSVKYDISICHNKLAMVVTHEIATDMERYTKDYPSHKYDTYNFKTLAKAIKHNITQENIDTEIINLDNSDAVFICVPRYRATGYLVFLGIALSLNKPVYVYGDLERFNASTMFSKDKSLILCNTFDECLKIALQ